MGALGADVAQLQQMGGSVPGRTSLVRGSGLVVDVGVERSWRSHVAVFQQVNAFLSTVAPMCQA
jgi:hypothetical protein